jgi:uncharacterized protein (DUF2141 family)
VKTLRCLTIQLAAFFAILALSFSMTSLLPAAQAAPLPSAQLIATDTLTVRVTGVRNAKGKVIVYLFRDPQGFPTDASRIMRQQSVSIDPSTMTARVAFKDLPPGTFAVTVLHDENDNGKMDTNFLGIPTEGTGASNDPNKMRAPTFDEAKFLLNAAEQTVDVKLRYVF